MLLLETKFPNGESLHRYVDAVTPFQAILDEVYGLGADFGEDCTLRCQKGGEIVTAEHRDGSWNVKSETED